MFYCLLVIETLTDTSLNRKKVLLAKLSQNNSYPEIKLFLLSYECIMCTRHILEVRVLFYLFANTHTQSQCISMYNIGSRGRYV